MNPIKGFIARQLGQPSGWFGRWLMRLLNRENAGMNQLALAQLNVQPGDAVLEIGFGGGYLLEQLLQTQGSSLITGVDPSQDVLKLGQKRFQQAIEQGQLDLRMGQAEALPFPDNSFDKAVTVNTLYFWSDAPLVLQECQRVLRPGGKLVVCFNSAEFLQAHQLNNYGFKSYQVADVEHLFQKANFSAIQTISRASQENGQFFCTCGTLF